MRCRRFVAAGRVTNYEMELLRKDRTWRDTGWSHVWASVSTAFHPRSLKEWQHAQGGHHGDEKAR